MTHIVRIGEAAIGLVVVALGAVKVFTLGSGLLQPPIMLVTVVELAVGISLVSGRRPLTSAGALALLGAVLTTWTLLAGPSALADGRCGCFGGFHVRYFEHVLVAAGLLAAGGALYGAHRAVARQP